MPDQVLTDETPIWSRRQLIQSAGQFVMAFAGGVLAVMLASPEATITGRAIGVCALQALLVAGGVLGFSFATK